MWTHWLFKTFVWFCRFNILKKWNWPKWRWTNKPDPRRSLPSSVRTWRRRTRWRPTRWWTGRRTPSTAYRSSRRYARRETNVQENTGSPQPGPHHRRLSGPLFQASTSRPLCPGLYFQASTSRPLCPGLEVGNSLLLSHHRFLNPVVTQNVFCFLSQMDENNVYMQRQTVLKEIEKVRNRENDLKLRMEGFEK